MSSSNIPEIHHIEEIQDIITIPPNWLLRWGITLFFFIIIMFIVLSAFIKYPEIVKAQLKIQSPNSPKQILAKIPGKLAALLVKDNTFVKKGQPLAYIESTANHEEVLNLLSNLKNLQSEVLGGRPIGGVFFKQFNNGELGELQTSYQSFFQAYLAYKSSVDNGFFLKQRIYLKNDLINLENQKKELESQQSIQQREAELAEKEYAMHKKLVAEKVETPAEFRQQESKYLSKKSPLIQTEASLITSNMNYAAKQKEILTIDNQITEEKGKFIQSLNSLISQAEEWKNKYVLTSSVTGKLVYAGIVQENQVLDVNQEVFNINPGNEEFFGEMPIPQISMGKVMEGQKVLIKLKSYPYEEYGILRGTISYIADVPYRDSVFISKVNFSIKNSSDMKRNIRLKPGMIADAEIITKDATVLQRISNSFIKILK